MARKNYNEKIKRTKGGGKGSLSESKFECVMCVGVCVCVSERNGERERAYVLLAYVYISLHASALCSYHGHMPSNCCQKCSLGLDIRQWIHSVWCRGSADADCVSDFQQKAAEGTSLELRKGFEPPSNPHGGGP